MAENGVGYRLVAIPPKTGFMECIRLAKIRQAAFLTGRVYRAPTHRSNQWRNFCFSSTGGIKQSLTLVGTGQLTQHPISRSRNSSLIGSEVVSHSVVFGSLL